MTSPARPLILLDPHPRPIELIFDSATRVRLEALGDVIWHDGAPAADSILEKHLPAARYLIGQTSLPRERLDRAPELRAIFNVEGNFLPNVDYAECQRRGIAVLSTAPVFAPPVAEMALGLALAAARRIPQADAAIRAGTESLYGAEDNFDSILLQGRTMGLVGFGNLGRALAPLLRPFGGEVLAHDPWVDPAVLAAAGVIPAARDEIFDRSAVVFICSAVTTENAGQIGAACFERLAPGGIVILVSRAGVVDFDALLDAAGSGRIRAAIDVWPEEPIPPDHRARRTPNTILSAHRAGNIPEIWPEMGRRVTDDIALLEQGLPPRHCQPAHWETVAKLRSKPVGWAGSFMGESPTVNPSTIRPPDSESALPFLLPSMLSPTRAPVILLVEDSDDDAYFFRRTLKKSGTAHELIWLQDGRSAVQHFERQQAVDDPAAGRPDIIFLDLKLPNFSGFDVLEWYAASGIPPDAPIIVLSGSDHPGDLDRAAKLGASGYLVKPVDPNQLRDLLADHALASAAEVPS